MQRADNLIFRVRVRPGFALVWALMFVAIATTLVGVTMAAMLPVSDLQRVDSTAAILRAVGVGINSFEQSVALFPGKISQLDTQITNTQHSTCSGTKFGGGALTSWTNNGPFLKFWAPPDDVVTPLGLIRDSIPDRTANKRDSIWIEIPNVDSALAMLLDLRVDGTLDSLHDTVRLTRTGPGVMKVRFRVTPRAANVC